AVRGLRAIWLTRYGECQKTRRGCRNRKRLVPGASGDVGLKRATGGPAIRNESVLRPRGRSDFPRGRSEFCRWRGGFLLGGRGKRLALLDPLGGWIPPTRGPASQFGAAREGGKRLLIPPQSLEGLAQVAVGLRRIRLDADDVLGRRHNVGPGLLEDVDHAQVVPPQEFVRLEPDGLAELADRFVQVAL